MTQQQHPLVFGMRAVWPGQLGRIEMHQTRTGGDLSHIRPGRTHMNEFLVGGEGWKEQLEEDIRRASELNHRHAYAARRWTRKRKGEAEKIKRGGPVDPWKRDRSEGPLREGVLTANRKHFEGDMPGFPSVEKEARFRAAALKFLREQFGPACVAAWSDSDEEAFHIHFVVAPWVVSESKQAGGQRRIEPSSIPVVKDYEAGHDIAAEYFASAGLVRGEKRAEARRDAFEAEAESELPAKNTPCHEWRADEAVRLDEKRKKAARAWQQARRKEAAAEEASRRAEAVSQRNAAEERRREKKHQARLAAVEAQEKRQTEKQAEIENREREVEFREERAEVTMREQNAFAEKLQSAFEAMKKFAEKFGFKEHELFKTAADKVEEIRQKVGKIGGWQRTR